ncbi:protein kinase [Streptomyces sp. NBC_01239]|uniref:serine/threonine-protein kinase n=1 Tax=Streptomyces sp. NBC_01239 TaxID=2903792 RepID=UPI0022586A39|nr:serine/threonine protein kinase [Streptomyces sp. NBC_01239]MCX4811080.1 protein kinase [Streptomyces sp. NBC_01239]
MGRVWRAADEILDRQVAVKEMRIDGLDAEDTRTRRERTLREARATARIDHPNVVRVYDVVDEGERLWIVMELVAGRSLERMLTDDGALGPREVARIGLGLVAALRQVHAGGVLHRDIKPGNVLVENGGRRVVLTDFGIAAIQDATALTVVGMLVGSPDYMAPERISGRPQGPPSDIWSLGATLCAALGGRSPFSRDTTLATLHAVLYEEPELPAAAGPLRDVLAALLEKEPSGRPGLEEVEGALTRVAFPAEGAESAEGRGELAAPETELEQEPPPEAYRESPTPVFLAPSLVRAARDPRVYDPHPVEDAIPTQRPAVEERVSAAEAVSEAASELSSEAPPSNSRGSAPRRTGVSFARADQGERTEPAAQAGPSADPQPAERAHALTERKPVPRPAHPPAPRSAPPHPAPQRPDLGPHPARVPRGGELPGPAQPFTPDHPHRTRRRIALIAVAAVVVAAAVTGTILANTGGSSGTSAAGSSTSTEPSASSSASLSPSPTAPSASPSPTVEGTSRPPTLPPGTHQEAGGFAWATPAGWRRDLKTGAEVHYTSPDGSQELVGKSALARGDLMETWKASERNAQQGRDYRKIRLDRTTFRGFPAVTWEYTFTLKGTPWHARLLGFDEDGKSYQINTWYQPGVETQALETYDKVRDSFVVL